MNDERLLADCRARAALCDSRGECAELQRRWASAVPQGELFDAGNRAIVARYLEIEAMMSVRAWMNAVAQGPLPTVYDELERQHRMGGLPRPVK